MTNSAIHEKKLKNGGGDGSAFKSLQLLERVLMGGGEGNEGVEVAGVGTRE